MKDKHLEEILQKVENLKEGEILGDDVKTNDLKLLFAWTYCERFGRGNFWVPRVSPQKEKKRYIHLTEIAVEVCEQLFKRELTDDDLIFLSRFALKEQSQKAQKLLKKRGYKSPD